MSNGHEIGGSNDGFNAGASLSAMLPHQPWPQASQHQDLPSDNAYHSYHSSSQQRQVQMQSHAHFQHPLSNMPSLPEGYPDPDAPLNNNPNHNNEDDDDQDDDDSTTNSANRRRRATSLQIELLDAAFSQNPNPDAATRKLLGERTNMTPRSVQIWFQNRRARIRLAERNGAVIDPKDTAALQVVNVVSKRGRKQGSVYPHERKDSQASKPSHLLPKKTPAKYKPTPAVHGHGGGGPSQILVQQQHHPSMQRYNDPSTGPVSGGGGGGGGYIGFDTSVPVVHQNSHYSLGAPPASTMTGIPQVAHGIPMSHGIPVPHTQTHAHPHTHPHMQQVHESSIPTVPIVPTIPTAGVVIASSSSSSSNNGAGLPRMHTIPIDTLLWGTWRRTLTPLSQTMDPIPDLQMHMDTLHRNLYITISSGGGQFRIEIPFDAIASISVEDRHYATDGSQYHHHQHHQQQQQQDHHHHHNHQNQHQDQVGRPPSSPHQATDLIVTAITFGLSFPTPPRFYMQLAPSPDWMQCSDFTENSQGTSVPSFTVLAGGGVDGIGTGGTGGVYESEMLKSALAEVVTKDSWLSKIVASTPEVAAGQEYRGQVYSNANDAVALYGNQPAYLDSQGYGQSNDILESQASLQGGNMQQEHDHQIHQERSSFF